MEAGRRIRLALDSPDFHLVRSKLVPRTRIDRTGALISAVLAYLLSRKSTVWRDIRFSPARLYHFVLYTGVFVVELVRANINMMRYVFAPRIDIKPGIVEIKTKLKTPVGRFALANSIALTPGSLVIDIEGDSLFIHWLDVKTTDPDEATRADRRRRSRSIWRKPLAEGILIVAAILIFARRCCSACCAWFLAARWSTVSRRSTC